MSKGWTEERRKRQAEMIRRHKPWEKSTGPKSDAGKAASSKNAVKHGLYGVDGEMIRALLARNQEFLELYARFTTGETLETVLKRTDRKCSEIKPRPPRVSLKRGTK